MRTEREKDNFDFANAAFKTLHENILDLEHFQASGSQTAVIFNTLAVVADYFRGYDVSPKLTERQKQERFLNDN